MVDAPFDLIDTHVHVFDPARFPYSAARSYTPPAATVGALRAHLATLAQPGKAGVVLVQPSVYGHDNACLLDAIAHLRTDCAHLRTDCARGIAVVDLTRSTPEQLLALDAGGVRGVRLNLEVRHETDASRTRLELARAGELVELPGWCVQVHCAAALLPVLAQSLDNFHVPLVLDHFAGLKAANAHSQTDALNCLLDLLDSGRVYIKLSAFYRASGDAPNHADLAPLARRLMAARPDRLLWGSDWPHTGGGHASATRDPSRIEPFREVDLSASLAALKGWAPDAASLQQVLVDNAAQLYGFASATEVEPKPHTS